MAFISQALFSFFRFSAGNARRVNVHILENLGTFIMASRFDLSEDDFQLTRSLDWFAVISAGKRPRSFFLCGARIGSRMIMSMGIASFTI